MNRQLIIRKIYKNSILLALLLVSALMYTCSIYDDTDDCPHAFAVRFVYDYNMKFADAFNHEVDHITLHVFDKEGNFLFERTDEGWELQNQSYHMDLDLEPGDYNFIAWAGLTGVSFERTRALSTDTGHMSDLQVELQCEERISGNSLVPLWHGDRYDVHVEGHGYEETVVPLIKDTKTIRMVLQQVNGAPMTEEDFSLVITDDNGILAYDNSIVPSETITYTPYISGHQTVGDNPPATVVFFETHTNRLMVDSKARLTINRTSDGRTIVDIPLIDYLLLTELEGYKDLITEQEYLDRQDEYTLVFFLDENLAWLQIQIIVNGWTVRFNNEGFD